MNIYNSETYISDVKKTLLTLDLSSLYGKTVLITGATGLICSSVVDLLLLNNEINGANTSVYVAARSYSKLLSRFLDKEKSGLIPIEYDATAEITFGFNSDYIIHGASNASPDKYVAEPVDTLLANIIGVRNLLSYGKKCSMNKLVYISSSEVYGKTATKNPIAEDQYGIVDILSPRSSYTLGKQSAETLCVAYANQYGINVSMARPGHIYGPTAQRSDKRVSSAFAIQAAAGEDLVMKSAGTQLRSYCYCLDCASAILTILLKGETGQAYNISNKNSVITIRQMAQLIAEKANVKLQLDIPTDSEKLAFNPMDNSSLNSTKLESLGWQGIFDADTGFEHTIKAIKESGI